MKKGDLVVDSMFGETHKVLLISKGNDGKLYATVQNISGPGCYQGHELFAVNNLTVKEES